MHQIEVNMGRLNTTELPPRIFELPPWILELVVAEKHLSACMPRPKCPCGWTITLLTWTFEASPQPSSSSPYIYICCWHTEDLHNVEVICGIGDHYVQARDAHNDDDNFSMPLPTINDFIFASITSLRSYSFLSATAICVQRSHLLA